VQAINDKLEVFDGDKLIWSKQLVLKPLETFADTIRADVKLNQVRVKLGGNKLEYSANPDSDVLGRPLESPKDFDWNSVYGLYLQGKEDIRQRYYAAAKEKLEACLRKDPNFLPPCPIWPCLSTAI